MVKRYRLGEAFGTEPAPAPEEVRQLPFGQPQRARKARQVGDVRPVLAEIADGGLDGFVVTIGRKGHDLVHRNTHDLVLVMG